MLRPLLRAVLRLVRARLLRDWPKLRFLVLPTDDHLEVTCETHAGARDLLRAYFRTLELEDRMLNRRVRFRKFKPADAPDQDALLTVQLCVQAF